jgi:hypothetical protein
MSASDASSISLSLELPYTIMAWSFFFFFSWLALKAKSFFLEDDEPSSGVMCMYIS